MKTKGTAATSASNNVLRFAHPFFTNVDIKKRKKHPGVGVRLRDHIEQTVRQVPAPTGNSRMNLADIVGTAGAREIEQEGALRFHSVGDTGRKPDSPEETVALAMAEDFDVDHPGKSPAFFFHLGDVIYGHDKDQAYRREFYEPYKHYPGKIIAIPGNHDGEVFPSTDPKSLKAFIDNFCDENARVPEIAGSVFRQTMTQPGVYWLLETPFADLIGLYSNCAENPGFISGDIPGPDQMKWLVETLKHVKSKRDPKSRKALILATHHPPYSSGGHSGSSEMLQDIDDACGQAGIFPDLFLSGHAHSYQRYTRTHSVNGKRWKIPYIVAGTGGVGEQHIGKASKDDSENPVFESSFKGYGFLRITAKVGSVKAEFFGVDVKSGKRKSVDDVKISLDSHP